jgi:hypothetical protein
MNDVQPDQELLVARQEVGRRFLRLHEALADEGAGLLEELGELALAMKQAAMRLRYLPAYQDDAELRGTAMSVGGKVMQAAVIVDALASITLEKLQERGLHPATRSQ